MKQPRAKKLSALLSVVLAFALLSMVVWSQQPEPASLFAGEVRILAGSFVMGAAPKEPEKTIDELPQHRVTLTRSFAMLEHEVTQGLFQSVMGYNPAQLTSCKDLKSNKVQTAQCPVESVTWHEALAFCNKLSRQRGLPLCFDCKGKGADTRCQVKKAYQDQNGKGYYRCKGYRLPTEAEWEYAARASTTTPFYTGKCLSSRQANHDGRASYKGCFGSRFHKHTVAVKSFAPNRWGLYDMAGNVYEWVFDGAFRKYTPSPLADPIFTTGSIRVRRGGSWASDPSHCRSAYRRRYAAHVRISLQGFRPNRTLD